MTKTTTKLTTKKLHKILQRVTDSKKWDEEYCIDSLMRAIKIAYKQGWEDKEAEDIL